MVLPLLFGALAPSLLPGMSPILAGALGSGLGAAVQTGDLEQGLLTGIGAFAGGHLLGPMLGGGAKAATDAATTAASAAGPVGMGMPAAAAPGAGGIAGLPMKANLATIGTGANAMNVAGGGGVKGLLGGAMDFTKSPAGMGMGIGAMAGPMLSGIFGKGGESGDGRGKGKNKYGAREPRPIPRIPMMPGANYTPGVSGEHNYGIGVPYSAEQIMGYNRGGMVRRMARPNIPMIGPVRLSSGGIVALAGGGDPGAAAPNEREIISAAISAVKGQHPRPEIALGAFLARYGEEALRDLVSKVRSGEMDDTAERFASGENGEVRGPGDGSGIDDKVPAKMEDGSGDVLLSDGEFVLRKDAAESLEKMFGGGFLDSVNRAGPKAAQVARRTMAAA